MISDKSLIEHTILLHCNAYKLPLVKREIYQEYTPDVQ